MDKENHEKTPLFTGKGDEGDTKDLFGRKIPKSGLLTELFVKIDYLQAGIDKIIFNYPLNEKEKTLLKKVQKKIRQSYLMIQDPNNKKEISNSFIKKEDLIELEEYINSFQKYSKNNPKSFIRFKTQKEQDLNYCRISSRDAEISLNRFFESKNQENKEIDKLLLSYFNRLSSLFFVIALKEKKVF